LFGGISVGWAIEEEFDAEFFGGFVRALFAGDEVSVPLLLGMRAMVSFLELELGEESEEDLEQPVKNERIKQKVTKGTKKG